MMFNSILVSLLLTSTALASSHRQQRQERTSHEAIGSKISSRAARPPSGKVIESCTVPGTFALTFNDGVAPGSKISTILQANGVKGSFFVAGSNYGSCIYDQADELIARYKAGHLMGITMWDFSDITTLSVVQLIAELDFMEAAFSKILGVRPAFFRPPYGNYDAVSLALVTMRGYNVVTWSFDGGDDNGIADPEVIAAYQAIPPYPQTQTSISVSGEYTGEGFLDIVVKNLLKKGYKPVTVAACLGLSPYQVTGGIPGKRDSSWNCNSSPLHHITLTSAGVNAASSSSRATIPSSSSASGSTTSASSSKAAASSTSFTVTSSSSIAPKASSLSTSSFSTETKSITTAISSKPSQSSVVIVLAPSSSSSSGSAYTSVTTSRSGFTSATPSPPTSVPMTSASASTSVIQANKSIISSTIATSASPSSTSGTTSLSSPSSIAVSSVSTLSPKINTSATLASSSSKSFLESTPGVSSYSAVPSAPTTSASLATSTKNVISSTAVPTSASISPSLASTSTPISMNSVASSSDTTSAKASATPSSSSTLVSSSTVISSVSLAISSSTTLSASTKPITASPVSTFATTQSASASTSAQSLASTSTASRVYPVPTPVSGEVINSCKNPGDFALTYDDGPYTAGRSITDLLDKHNSLGTFFVNGNNFGCIYDYAEDLQARYLQGHQIASHTWTHPDITNITSAAFEKELDLIETALMKILGIKPAFFRPPYGAYDDRTLAILKKRNYNVVYWSFDSEDWRTAPVADTLASYKKVIGKYPTPQISLNHETYQTTADKIMPVVVPELLAAGYKLVTVSECLDIAPYAGVIGELGIRDKTWTCDGTPSG